MTETEVYVPRNHIVIPHGPVTYADSESETKVKLYTLIPENEEDFNPCEIANLNNSMCRKFAIGTIKRRFGLGYAVISEGIFNVQIWGDAVPSLHYPSLYTFDRKELAIGDANLRKVSVEEEGVLCCYEDAIAGHEGRAWRDFLFSSRTHVDKAKYMFDTLKGFVGR